MSSPRAEKTAQAEALKATNPELKALEELKKEQEGLTARHVQQLAVLQGELEIARTRLTEANDLLQERGKEIAGLLAENSSRGAEVETLKAGNAVLQGQCERLNAESERAAASDELARDLKASLAAAEASLQKADKDIELLKAELGSFCRRVLGVRVGRVNGLNGLHLFCIAPFAS